jgi:GNAT superfamily N-acetyltransferase
VSLAVRRVHADEWERVRELRLAALGDPDAGIAFYGSLDRASVQPDDFWRRRAERTAAGDADAQFVAVVDDEWVGSATVLSRPAEGDVPAHADIVAVYVRPEHRGSGTIDALLAAAIAWARSIGHDRVQLTVHASNTRAQRAYRRAGFVPTGAAFTGPNGLELVFAQETPAGA